MNHPRGMLGKHHSKATIAKLKKWRPTAEQLLKMTHHKENHPGWTGDRKKVECQICHKIFLIRPTLTRKFCSNYCRIENQRTPQPKCKLCGKELSTKKAKFCNPCKGTYYSGKRSNSWKGGRTALGKKLRSSDKYNRWRFKIFKRDKFTCLLCGKKGILNADHYPIKFSELLEKYKIKTYAQGIDCKNLWELKIARTLCFKCHRESHKNYERPYKNSNNGA